MAAWGVWPGFLVGQDWRLCSAVVCSFGIGSLPIQSRAVGWALWLVRTVSLGPKPGKSAKWALWPIIDSGLALQIGKATGWDFCIGASCGNIVHQDPWACSCKPHPLLHLYLIPSDPCEERAIWVSWGASCNAGQLDVHFGLSWCSTVPSWGGAMQSKWICSSYPSNTALLGFCGQRRSSDSPLGSEIFIKVSFLWIVAIWSSCEGDWSQKWPILPSWSLPFFLPCFLVLTRYSSLILNVSFSSSRISHFSKKPSFLILENSIRSQDLHAGYAFCY